MATDAPVLKPKFDFIGGELCLDFCNTVGGSRGGTAREYLPQYSDLIRWTEQAHLASHSAGEALRERANLVPEEAEAVHARALALREAIYRVFEALAHHHSPQESDLAILNSELGRGLNRMQLGRHGKEFLWHWAGDAQQLDHMLAPIARSAAELLVSGHWRGHVSQCHGDNCGWLFLDSSKNHSRRWCDMRDCGNRAKVRRHRQRQKRSERKAAH